MSDGSTRATSVGPARLEDAQALAELRRAVLSEGRWFATLADEYHGGTVLARATIEGLLRQPNGTVLVARVDGELVGMLAVHGERLMRMEHVGRLEMMVAATARGRGVGTALLDACLRWAEANPVLLKLSLAVFADNARAITLYTSRGFIVEGRREGEYLLEDGKLQADLLMARNVAR